MERRTGLADAVDQVEQLAGRASKPIDLRDHDRVAGLEASHQLGKLRPVGPGAADLFAVDTGGAERLQGLDLAAVVLVGLKAQIAGEIYKAFERLDADVELLAIVGSWRDTLDDAEVLELLQDYNARRPTLHRPV